MQKNMAIEMFFLSNIFSFTKINHKTTLCNTLIVKLFHSLANGNTIPAIVYYIYL
jgi:hypothetical protein